MLARTIPFFAALLLMSPRFAAAEPPAMYDDTSYDGVHAEWAAGTSAVAPRELPGRDDTSYAGLAVEVGGARPTSSDEGGPDFSSDALLASTAARRGAPAEASACHCAKSSPAMHGGDVPGDASSAHKAKHHG